MSVLLDESRIRQMRRTVGQCDARWASLYNDLSGYGSGFPLTPNCIQMTSHSNTTHFGPVANKWWHREDDDRIVCDLCPRQCRMKEGDRGFCFVRKVESGQMVLDTYGKSTAFCIDPIEKKPLNHFFPGTSVLSFGTAGCNLGCQFCQNWDISKSREVARLSARAEPELIAHAAKELGCASVAFTYNDPVIWAEYAIDTANACRELGIKSVAVTAGYISPEARREFFSAMDAANVDLKAFTEEFYRKITYSKLEPVLDTLRYLKHETDVWFEITNLVIPQANDSADELKRMCDWIVRELGPDVPVHFSAFHPDFRMTDRPATPHSTLIEAYNIALRAGIYYPYVGNVHDPERGSTRCYRCSNPIIVRDWYELGDYAMDGNRCRFCGTAQFGRFGEIPGAWGRKRQPVDLESFRNSLRSDHQDRISLPILSPTRTSATTPSEEIMKQPVLTQPVKLNMLRLESLSHEQKQEVQRAAQRVVIAKVLNQRLATDWAAPLGPIADQFVMGMFTTLKRGAQLRACCGFLGRPTSLAEAIVVSAERTAKEDPRMPAISPAELAFLTLDVSLLSAPVPMTVEPSRRWEHVVIGQHGLKITQGNQAGLLLPTVAVENGWDAKRFLNEVCRKAGLPDTAWQSGNNIVESFDGLAIDGEIDDDLLPKVIPMVAPPGDLPSLIRLKETTTQNMLALSRGATPTYYAPNGLEGNVHTLVMTIVDTGTRRPIAHWIKTSLRPGFALQSSLFQLCESATEVLSRTKFERTVDIDLAITVLFDPVQHGTIEHSDWNGKELKETLARCDMSGIQSKTRGILALCSNRAAVAFDPQKTIDQLVLEAASSVRVRHLPIAIFSMGCMSTVNSLLANNATPPLEDPRPRVPAVAETFYPADPVARRQLLDTLRTQEAPKSSSALAIMTPHAGLAFSGAVALDTWSRVQLPSSLLIISPKHTGNGVDWAVAPAASWQLPGTDDWEPDTALVQRIVQEVDGMELDMAAHAREHGIEVQLPILEYLTQGLKRPKIAAIAISNATLEEIDLVAEQLATLLLSLPERPLLVISSDMNHYSPEAENRRRDQLAIDALLTGDANRLIDVCKEHSISMCGLVPAAIVLKTLHRMGEPFHVEKVGYETSADRGGDKSQVVGYAGVLIRSGK